MDAKNSKVSINKKKKEVNIQSFGTIIFSKFIILCSSHLETFKNFPSHSDLNKWILWGFWNLRNTFIHLPPGDESKTSLYCLVFISAQITSLGRVLFLMLRLVSLFMPFLLIPNWTIQNLSFFLFLVFLDFKYPQTFPLTPLSSLINMFLDHQ